METHMPYRIIQCHLAPCRGDIPALTPAEAGTRFSDPGGMQGWVDLVGWLHAEMVYVPKDSHPVLAGPGTAISISVVWWLSSWSFGLLAILLSHSNPRQVILMCAFVHRAVEISTG